MVFRLFVLNKGLGEMNKDQLRETTLDPAQCSLLQVHVGDPATTDEILSTLMGDAVEPRRDFIISHANASLEVDV